MIISELSVRNEHNTYGAVLHEVDSEIYMLCQGVNNKNGVCYYGNTNTANCSIVVCVCVDDKSKHGSFL